MRDLTTEETEKLAAQLRAYAPTLSEDEIASAAYELDKIKFLSVLWRLWSEGKLICGFKDGELSWFNADDPRFLLMGRNAS